MLTRAKPPVELVVCCCTNSHVLDARSKHRRTAYEMLFVARTRNANPPPSRRQSLALTSRGGIPDPPLRPRIENGIGTKTRADSPGANVGRSGNQPKPSIY